MSRRTTYDTHEVHAALRRTSTGKPIFSRVAVYYDILAAYEERKRLKMTGVEAKIVYKKHSKALL